MRITGGNAARRILKVPKGLDVRPTPDLVKQAVFNSLGVRVVDARVLELFAGSGALSFEAASREAKSVIQVENNPQACRALKENAVALAAEQIKIVQSDVFRYLAGDAEAFDIVFIDPPFAQNLAVQTCQWLEDKGWLSPHAKIYVETESTLKLVGMPENWRLLKSKTAGEVGYHLFERG